MAVKVLPADGDYGNYDDSVEDAPWQNNVDLPGQFGPGGFRASPKLTAPASGPPPGLSLPGDGGGGTFDSRGGSAFRGPRWGGNPPPGFNMGDTVVPPANSTIPSGKQVGAWTNPFTDAHINPATGQPEMLTGPGGIAEKTAGGFNPLSLLGGGNPYWRGAIAGAGVMAPTPAETGEFNPAMITGRPDAPLPLHMPHRPVTPTPGATPMPARPVTPTPITAYPTPTPPPRPRAAGPAAVKQQPNLGYFTTGDRPNANPNIGGGMLGGGFAGGRGGPVGNRTMGMLDLSKLFSRQQ